MRAVILHIAWLVVGLFCSALAHVPDDPPRMTGPMSPYESDVLSARPTKMYLGLLLQGGAVFHQGSYSPNCDCSFGPASIAAPVPGIEVLVLLPKRSWGVRLGIRALPASHDFTYTVMRPTPVVGEDQPIDASYRKSSSVDYALLLISPCFMYLPSGEDLAFWMGPELRVPLMSHYDNIEDVLTPGVEYYDGATRHVLLPTSSIPDGARVGLALTVGGSWNIPLSSRFSLAPLAEWSLPLTRISSRDNDWKLGLLSGGLSLRYRMM